MDHYQFWREFNKRAHAEFLKNHPPTPLKQEKIDSFTIIQRLTPDYVCGFIDGEGSFTIYVGEQSFAMFSLGQSGHEGKWILENIQRFFKCGNIYCGHIKGSLIEGTKYRRSANQYKYQVYSSDCYRFLLPFFDEHKLILKKKQYQTWRKAVLMIWKGEHFTAKGIQELKRLKKALH